MQPVMAGMCKLESIVDGTLDLEHIAWANEALRVKHDNERRAREAAEDKRRNGR